MAAEPGPFGRRRAGVLLHLSSLPSRGFGPDAVRFVDWLASCGASVWQMLPVGPVEPNGSPYQLRASTALHSGFIDLAELGAHLGMQPPSSRSIVARDRFLAECSAAFAAATGSLRTAFDAFVESERPWLEEFALFESLRARFRRKPWWQWPSALAQRDRRALQLARREFVAEIQQRRFEQFTCYRQWQSLREHARARGVLLFGDLPLYVAEDSVDVWVNRELFRWGSSGVAWIAGVPPDYFAADGQVWGNPLYDWSRMQTERFAWWVERVRRQLALFEFLRIDHFRGLESCWEIPARTRNAREGRWRKVPGDALLRRLRNELGALPSVAEDLGDITPAVHALRERFGLPGMCVLQFAFDGSPDNPYLPHNHTRNSVVYTGTHDNDTLRGWYAGLDQQARRRVVSYLDCGVRGTHEALLRAAYQSVAAMAIIPMQDLLRLDSRHRTNTPATEHGNWKWRLRWEQIPLLLSDKLQRWSSLYGRQPPAAAHREK